MDKKMLDELIEAAATRMKATKPATPEHDQALGEFLDLGRLSIERDKVENAYESQTYELNLRETEEKERRRLDEKKIDNEADAKLKEILVEKLKMKVTPGMIFQATTAAVVTLVVLNYEKTGVITTKAFNNWFRKTI